MHNHKTSLLSVHGDILLFVFGLLSIIGLLAYQGTTELDDFEIQQQALLSQSARATSEQISLTIAELRKRGRLFTEDHSAQIRALTDDSDNESIQQQLESQLHRHFPQLLTFSISDNQGNLLVNEFDDRIGEICITDIRNFTNTHADTNLRIHPNSQGYHVDIMNQFDDKVFLMSIKLAQFSNIIKHHEFDGHRYFLTTPNKPQLIEVSALGSRDQLGDNTRISDLEWQSRVIEQSVESTGWHLVVIPNSIPYELKQQALYSKSGWLLLVLSLIGIMLLYLLRLVNKDRIRAQQADLHKSEFLSTMSHEIRTPMNSIIGFSELLDHSTLGPKERSYVSGIREAGDTLLAMITDVLDLSRIEAGHMEFEEAAFDLKGLCESTLNLFQPQALHKRLDLQLNFELEDTTEFLGDSTRIRQILVNLVGNAIKFTDYGYIKIRVLPTDPSNKCNLRIEVIDTGIGMNTEQSARVFNAFTQAEASTTRRYGGTGLGLTISKRLTELMGGEIGVDSRTGEGSIFWLELPLLPERRSDDLGAPQGLTNRRKITNQSHSPFVLRQQADGPASITTLSPANVLVVDDTPTNRLVLRGMLEEMGHHVITADNAKQAISKALKMQPDIVLMDSQMPDKDGWQATEILRKRGFLKPIIGVSANALRADRERCLKSGMNDYLVKPVGYSEVGNIIAQYQPNKHQSKPMSPVNDWQLQERDNDNEDFLSHLSGMKATFSQEGLERLLEAYLQEAEGELKGIQTGFADGDLEALERNAHSLKGSSAAIGAKTLAETCGELVNMTRGGSLGGADILIQDANRQIEDIRHAIKGWRIDSANKNSNVES